MRNTVAWLLILLSHMVFYQGHHWKMMVLGEQASGSKLYITIFNDKKPWNTILDRWYNTDDPHFCWWVLKKWNWRTFRFHCPIGCHCSPGRNAHHIRWVCVVLSVPDLSMALVLDWLSILKGFTTRIVGFYSDCGKLLGNLWSKCIYSPHRTVNIMLNVIQKVVWIISTNVNHVIVETVQLVGTAVVNELLLYI